MKKPILYQPAVFNVFKPVGMSSYDVIRHFKRNLNTGFGKIGHFGTLDPFACGVLLVGIAGATRINNLVHDLFPKTYLAVGKMTDTRHRFILAESFIQNKDGVILASATGKLFIVK